MPTSQPPVVCLGFSHHTTAVSFREQLTCPLPQLINKAADLSDKHAQTSLIVASEMALIYTCNRWELYVSTEKLTEELKPQLLNLVAQAHGLTADTLEACADYRTGYEAIEHLLRVACGLESQVLGEAQVLGQVEDAFTKAENMHSLGPVLKTVFQTAICAGKRVRTQTSIGNKAASISSVALAKAQQAVGDLRERNILVVGLGEMACLALKALRARRVGNIGLVNRTLERAEAEAEHHRYRIWSWDSLASALAWADVVYVATGANQHVLTALLLQEALKHRRGRSLVIVDAGVPRNVEPSVNALEYVHLFDIDDLQGTLDKNLGARRQAVPEVEKIIDQEISCLRARLDELTVRPLIVDLHQKAEAIRQQELERTLKYLGDVDPVTLSHVEHLTTSLVNKLLHEPTVRLRQQAKLGTADPYIDAISELFGLELGSR